MEERSFSVAIPLWLPPPVATPGVPSHQLSLFICFIQADQTQELARTIHLLRGYGRFVILRFFRMAAMPISQRNARFFDGII